MATTSTRAAERKRFAVECEFVDANCKAGEEFSRENLRSYFRRKNPPLCDLSVEETMAIMNGTPLPPLPPSPLDAQATKVQALIRGKAARKASADGRTSDLYRSAHTEEEMYEFESGADLIGLEVVANTDVTKTRVELGFQVSSWPKDTETHSGILPASAIGEDLMSLVPPSERQNVMQELVRAACGQAMVDYELPLISGKDPNEMTWLRVKSEADGPPLDVSAVEYEAKKMASAVAASGDAEEERRRKATIKIQALARGRSTRKAIARKPGQNSMEGWLHKKSTRGWRHNWHKRYFRISLPDTPGESKEDDELLNRLSRFYAVFDKNKDPLIVASLAKDYKSKEGSLNEQLIAKYGYDLRYGLGGVMLQWYKSPGDDTPTNVLTLRDDTVVKMSTETHSGRSSVFTITDSDKTKTGDDSDVNSKIWLSANSAAEEQAWITAIESVVTLQRHGESKAGIAKLLEVQNAMAARARIERLRARQAELQASLKQVKDTPPKSLLNLTFINELAVARAAEARARAAARAKAAAAKAQREREEAARKAHLEALAAARKARAEFEAAKKAADEAARLKAEEAAKKAAAEERRRLEEERLAHERAAALKRAADEARWRAAAQKRRAEAAAKAEREAAARRAERERKAREEARAKAAAEYRARMAAQAAKEAEEKALAEARARAAARARARKLAAEKRAAEEAAKRKAAAEAKAKAEAEAKAKEAKEQYVPPVPASWTERMENLIQRFPTLTPAEVRQTLHDAGGHAGKAATSCKMQVRSKRRRRV